MLLAFPLFMTWLLQTAWLLLLFTHLFPVTAIPQVKDNTGNEDVQNELYCRRAQWTSRGSTGVRRKRTRSTELPSSAPWQSAHFVPTSSPQEQTFSSIKWTAGEEKRSLTKATHTAFAYRQCRSYWRLWLPEMKSPMEKPHGSSEVGYSHLSTKEVLELVMASVFRDKTFHSNTFAHTFLHLCSPYVLLDLNCWWEA